MSVGDGRSGRAFQPRRGASPTEMDGWLTDEWYC
jgi:hypothetical protein